jgi:hypothetical protein
MNIEIQNVILQLSYNNFDEPYFFDEVYFVNEKFDEISDIQCEVAASKNRFGDFEIKISEISAWNKSGTIEEKIHLSKEDKHLLEKEIINHIFFM